MIELYLLCLRLQAISFDQNKPTYQISVKYLFDILPIKRIGSYVDIDQIIDHFIHIDQNN
jgi:hypothetical protein